MIFTKINAQNQFNLLLFTHHDPWHDNCIPAAVDAFENMAAKNQFSFDWTLDPDTFEKKLSGSDVVVFVNANSDMLSEQNIAALKTFMQNGGGFVGIHGASARTKKHEWFDNLIGGVFINHPKLQSGIINNVDTNFPGNLHLPNKWLWTDEWYNFADINYDKINICLQVDETSYNYTAGYDSIPMQGMGKKHPIAWYHNFEGGKVFYTALGHKPETYSDDNFLKHIYGGIYWVTRQSK